MDSLSGFERKVDTDDDNYHKGEQFIVRAIVVLQ